MPEKMRKRASGGGRKPEGPYAGNASWVTARIEPDLRYRLERQAKLNKRSLSQEIQWRLMNSFTARERQKRSKASERLYGWLDGADSRNHDLGVMVGEIAGRIEDTTGRPWNKNEYERAALLKAVHILLSRMPLPIEPHTSKPSEKLKKDIESFSYLDRLSEPDGLAEMIAHTYLVELDTHRTPPTDPPRSSSSADETEHTEFLYTDKYHRLPHFRRALELKDKE